jgi:hypothetical protein
VHPENHRWVTGDQFGVAFPRDDQSVRALLRMLSNLLNLWERHCMGDLFDAALADEERVA